MRLSLLLHAYLIGRARLNGLGLIVSLFCFRNKIFCFLSSSTALLQEKIYICDNLAYFPYQQQYEPLFMIHQIDLIVSVSGANLLQAFKGEESQHGHPACRRERVG